MIYVVSTTIKWCLIRPCGKFHGNFKYKCCRQLKGGKLESICVFQNAQYFVASPIGASYIPVPVYAYDNHSDDSDMLFEVDYSGKKFGKKHVEIKILPPRKT